MSSTASATPSPRGDAGRRLLTTVDDQWSATLAHPFFVHSKEGSLAPLVVDRYFQIEHGFVATAAATTGQAIALAGDLDARRRWAAALDHLLNEQIDWFQRVAARRELNLPADIVGTGNAGLSEHFSRLGRCGSYPELLGGVLGAEWLYATWCAPGARDSGDLAEWIDLHRQPTFTAHVEWLLDELERVWVASDAVTRERAVGAFRATLVGEVEFHDAAYEIVHP